MLTVQGELGRQARTGTENLSLHVSPGSRARCVQLNPVCPKLPQLTVVDMTVYRESVEVATFEHRLRAASKNVGKQLTTGKSLKWFKEFVKAYLSCICTQKIST